MRLRVVRPFLASIVLALAVVSSANAANSVAPGHQNVTVAPVLDSSRSSSATIGSAGGTLSTTTAGGAVLQLKLPRGALAGNEQVTMTPLKAMHRAGVKLVAGVELAPAGLRLLKTGLLYVTPASSVALTRQVAFGYQGNGSQFGLVPLMPRSRIEIPLLMFGGAGLARATPGQLAGRAAHRPSDPESAWLSQLAVPLYRIRAHRSAPADRQTVSGLLASFYDGYVKPLLRGSGASINSWTHAAVRSIAWEREVQMLRLTRQFAADAKRVRSTVFKTALRKRWRLVKGACHSGDTLTHLRNALVLARTAQRIGVGSRIGGATAIASGLQSCAQLNIQVALNQNKSGWQSGLSSTYLSQISSNAQTGSTPLALQQELGSDQFSFASPHTAVTERLLAWTLSPSYASQGCSQPTFIGFTTDPSQMYAVFGATLTVPADLFEGEAPPISIAALTVSGADLASWSVSCPHGVTTFSQPPGAVAGLGAVTVLTPIEIGIAASTTTQKFAGSVDILQGSTIIGYGDERGAVTVAVPL